MSYRVFPPGIGCLIARMCQLYALSWVGAGAMRESMGMQIERKREGIVSGTENRGRRLEQISDYLIWQPSISLSIINTIKTIAFGECSVSIVGEPGTCKEMVARQIHANSRRSENLFVPVDCSVVKEPLFVSQLFGHVKGSFAAATSDTLGVFRSADGGTVFLDEVEKLSSGLQARLLDVLRESRVMPVGSTKSHPVDVRIICATNRDLKQIVREGCFRADLYFHLDPVILEIPPLRTKKEDIIIMASYFLDTLAQLYNQPPKTLSVETTEILSHYNWPGNIKELASVIEHAYVLSESNEIKPSVLPADMLTKGVSPERSQTFPTLDDNQKKLLIRALQKTNGRKLATAKLLGISYGRLSRLIRKYELPATHK